MDVAEMAEIQFRREILAVIDRPGKTPRARLFAVLKEAFTLLKTIPVLQFFRGSDYDLLFRRVPAEKLQEHLAKDQMFFKELILRCQDAGIAIKVQPEQIVGSLFPLVTAVFHEDDLGFGNFDGSTDLLLELIAAFCLGEVELQLQKN